MSEDRIIDALKALREADDGREAGAEVEARLMDAFRKHRTRHLRMSVMAWTAAAAAAAVLFATVDRATVDRVTVDRPQPMVVRPVEPSVAGTPERSGSTPPLPAVTPATPSPRKAPHRRPAPLREIDTEFFPLLDVQPPFERGELVRVVVPASTMRDVGLPVSQDHLSDLVQADVLVGQEGLARAIRFVGFEK
jgi:hypothetical protein